jgi:hypothetical protein
MRLWLLLLAGCSFYDPDLGDRPFQCGTDDPKCPDGYTAAGDGRDCVCQRSALVPDAGMGYECAADPHEPNESTLNPAPTLLGMNNNMQYRSGSVAICGAGDTDVYQLNVPATDTLITVDVTFDATRMAPKVEILDRTAASIGGPDDSPAPGRVTLSKKVSAIGTYYVRVTAPQDVNYSAVLMLVPSQT